jgi:hypothetical protein
LAPEGSIQGLFPTMTPNLKVDFHKLAANRFPSIVAKNFEIDLVRA